MKRLALTLTLIALTTVHVRAEALDDDLINSPRLAALNVAQPAVGVPQTSAAETSFVPAAAESTEDAEITITAGAMDFEPAAPALGAQAAPAPQGENVASLGRAPAVFGVAPQAPVLGSAPEFAPAAPQGLVAAVSVPVAPASVPPPVSEPAIPEGVPTAPVSSSEAERIRVRNEDAKIVAKRTNCFKFVVDKNTSRMAVFDGTTKIGVFAVSFGSNASDDSYGASGTRNTPIGVFTCHAGRPSNNQFTWFIPYDVPGRSAMGIHGPKNGFLGSMLGLIHWTAGCIATHSRADILTIRAAHAAALKRGSPTRLIIGRGIDFQTIPGY